MRRPSRRAVTDWSKIIVILVLIGVVLYRVQMQEDRVEHQEETTDALAEWLSAEQEAIEEDGGVPVAPPPEEIIEDPDVDPPPPVGPTDEQVQAAVEDYFREHPVEDGENASPAQIAAAVINYFTENPVKDGAPGPPPSDEQISNAVAVYLAANPPPAGPPGPAGTNGTDGKDGTDGEDAEPLTSEQIQAELDAYLEANPLPMCPPGATAEARTLLATEGPVDVIVCVVQ
jgi:hypothetical protein